MTHRRSIARGRIEQQWATNEASHRTRNPKEWRPPSRTHRRSIARGRIERQWAPDEATPIQGPTVVPLPEAELNDNGPQTKPVTSVGARKALGS